ERCFSPEPLATAGRPVVAPAPGPWRWLWATVVARSAVTIAYDPLRISGIFGESLQLLPLARDRRRNHRLSMDQRTIRAQVRSATGSEPHAGVPGVRRFERERHAVLEAGNAEGRVPISESILDVTLVRTDVGGRLAAIELD